MEKVKVNKELFEVLNNVDTLSVCKSKAEDFVFTSEKFLILNTVSFEKMMDIHYKGYELEETPEEKLISLFEKELNISSKYGSEISTGYVLGIQNTLDVLGIEIKGINS